MRLYSHDFRINKTLEMSHYRASTGIDDALLCDLRSSCTKLDDALEVLLQGQTSLLQVVEITGHDFVSPHSSEA